jgi:hypothetical protein
MFSMKFTNELLLQDTQSNNNSLGTIHNFNTKILKNIIDINPPTPPIITPTISSSEHFPTTDDELLSNIVEITTNDTDYFVNATNVHRYDNVITPLKI